MEQKEIIDSDRLVNVAITSSSGNFLIMVVKNQLEVREKRHLNFVGTQHLLYTTYCKLPGPVILLVFFTILSINLVRYAIICYIDSDNASVRLRG